MKCLPEIETETMLHSGCGNGFEVVRYHSLVVSEDSLPDCLEATGWTCGMHHAVNLSGVSSEVRAFAIGFLQLIGVLTDLEYLQH